MKKEKTKTEKKDVKKTLSKSISQQRITEKATTGSTSGVFTFDVTPRSNKTEIQKEIFSLYKIKPIKINIINIPRKTTSFRGKKGFKSGHKKALVYLKEADRSKITVS